VACTTGTATVTWTRAELEELQREENKVWRFILGGPGYVAIAALRGDLGASTMQMRDLKTKLKYVRCLVKAESGELAKAVFEDMYIKKELCSGENCTVVYGLYWT